MKTLMLSVLPLLAPTTAWADEAQDKQEVAKVVRVAVEKVVAILKNDELARAEKRETVMEVIAPLIDFRLLAMLSLGKTHWTRVDAQQRETFTDLFVETLKLSYFEKLSLFTDEVVEFEPPVRLQTGGSPKYAIQSYIVSKGNRIQVGYHMTSRDGVWKAYDFEIEGVSIKKSYGSQYNDFLRENDFDALLDTMREKIAEAKAKDAEATSRG